MLYMKLNSKLNKIPNLDKKKLSEHRLHGKI
jgi:hypothetical protein